MKKRNLIINIILVVITLGISYWAFKPTKPTAYYLKMTYACPCYMGVYVVDDLDNKLVIIDYLDTCGTYYDDVVNTLETQPGWDSEMAAARAYLQIRGL